jgi:hypothetical protein
MRVVGVFSLSMSAIMPAPARILHALREAPRETMLDDQACRNHGASDWTCSSILFREQ